MTFEKLSEIIEENNIPKNVELRSNSECEWCDTNMDGIYYNEDKNVLMFVQEYSVGCTDYDDNDDWVLIYGTVHDWDEEEDDEDYEDDEDDGDGDGDIVETLVDKEDSFRGIIIPKGTVGAIVGKTSYGYKLYLAGMHVIYAENEIRVLGKNVKMED